MRSNSYTRVACKILKYLNDCYENGLDASIDSLNASMLGISDRQFYRIMKKISDKMIMERENRNYDLLFRSIIMVLI